MSGRFNFLIAGCLAAALLAAPALAADASAGAVEHSSWTDIIKALWPIVVVIGGLVSAGIVLGLSLRFPTIAAFSSLKADVKELQNTAKTHDRRIQTVEALCTGTPTRQELQEDISELRVICAGVEGKLDSLGAQGKTTNTYLQMLLEQRLAR